MGRLIGPVGFSRVVAVKRLHAAYAKDPGFCDMLLDGTARVAGATPRTSSPSWTWSRRTTSSCSSSEYVQGETLARLLRAAKRAGESMAPDIAVAVVIDILRGLHAAHEARGAAGSRSGSSTVTCRRRTSWLRPTARLVCWISASPRPRPAGPTRTTATKGKARLRRAGPTNLRGVNSRVDVFATSIVAWEYMPVGGLRGRQHDRHAGSGHEHGGAVAQGRPGSTSP